MSGPGPIPATPVAGERDPCRLLRLVLLLAAAHSAAVGVGLIGLPGRWLPALGLAGEGGLFFRWQGGVFHLLMAYAYLLAARRLPRARLLVHLAVTVKVAATLFLVLYCLLVDTAWVVAASAAGDGLLAGLLVAGSRRAAPCWREPAGGPPR